MIIFDCPINTYIRYQSIYSGHQTGKSDKFQIFRSTTSKVIDFKRRVTIKSDRMNALTVNDIVKNIWFYQNVQLI